MRLYCARRLFYILLTSDYWLLNSYIMVIPQKAKNILFSENVFLSFPRKRESIFYFSLLDSHFRGNDRDKIVLIVPIYCYIVILCTFWVVIILYYTLKVLLKFDSILDTIYSILILPVLLVSPLYRSFPRKNLHLPFQNDHRQQFSYI